MKIMETNPFQIIPHLSFIPTTPLKKVLGVVILQTIIMSINAQKDQTCQIWPAEMMFILHN